MSTYSIPPPLRDLLSKLAFFAMIERGKKPCVNDMSFVDSGSWFGAYKRWMTNEDRNNMVVQINAIIDQAIMAIDEYRGSEFFPLIINGLAKARQGISHLTSTYSDSPKTVSDIKICLDNIDLQLVRDKQHITISGFRSKSEPVEERKPVKEDTSNHGGASTAMNGGASTTNHGGAPTAMHGGAPNPGPTPNVVTAPATSVPSHQSPGVVIANAGTSPSVIVSPHSNIGNPGSVIGSPSFSSSSIINPGIIASSANNIVPGLINSSISTTDERIGENRSKKMVKRSDRRPDEN
jgi:hypothetical protein